MDEIKPQKVQCMSCDSLVVQVQIVHGGQWVVILYGDGTLHLREIGCNIPSVVDNTFKAVVKDVGSNDGINMSLSLSDCHETLLSLTILSSWDVFYSTVSMVYRVDTSDPSFYLLMPPKAKTHERYEGSPVVAGRLWAFAWWQGSRRLVAIVNIFDNQKREVVMDIGAFKFQGTISILSEKQILLSSRAGMYLFNIPDFQLVSESASIIRTHPVWTHNFESLDVYMYPNTSPPEGGQTATVAVLNGYNLRVFHADLQHSTECRVMSYSLQTHDPPRVHARNCLSSKRVFFCKDNMLQTCAIPAEQGLRDEPLQAGKLSSELYSLNAKSVVVNEATVEGKLRVQDISWDEASGRLCLLTGQHHDYEALQRFPLQIVVVDF